MRDSELALLHSLFFARSHLSRRATPTTMLAPPSTLLWDGAALLRSRASVAAGDPALHAAVDQLRADAAAAYSLPLQSVARSLGL
jgi:hypothetical protein